MADWVWRGHVKKIVITAGSAIGEMSATYGVKNSVLIFEQCEPYDNLSGNYLCAEFGGHTVQAMCQRIDKENAIEPYSNLHGEQWRIGYEEVP